MPLGKLISLKSLKLPRIGQNLSPQDKPHSDGTKGGIAGLKRFVR